VKSYKDLEIYVVSYDLAIKVHGMSLGLPQFEMYEEGSQVRRASKSVTANIVEGYGRRKYKAELAKFLIYAHASCDETMVHLNFIKDTHGSCGEELVSLLDRYSDLSRMISKFIQYVENNWQVRKGL
jgi:four helix bundle protein